MLTRRREAAKKNLVMRVYKKAESGETAV
ncbi:hypothetical protein SBDP1_1430001 [Syntrophobacter sp. SbD1]|nr:hypothetical protein SBDP1_1430001 [Syntrophobacter sp. SbD1]